MDELVQTRAHNCRPPAYRDDLRHRVSIREKLLSGSKNDLVSVLLSAVSIHDHELVLLMLDEKGVDIESSIGAPGTALQIAAYSQSYQLAKLLLSRGAAADGPRTGLRTALQGAAEVGDVDMVTLLLDYAAEVNRLYNGESALGFAARNGHTDVIRLLIDSGANVNAFSKAWGCPLGGAAANGHEAAVQLLIEAGANVNIRLGDLPTPIQSAGYSGNEKIVRTLLEAGVDVNEEPGNTGSALYAAAAGGNPTVFKLLLSYGAQDNDGRCSRKGPYLYAAIEKRSLPMVAFLLDNGSPLDEHEHALCLAIIRDCLDVVTLLLDRGAPVFPECCGEISPLWNATVQGDTALARILLEKGSKTRSPPALCRDLLEAAILSGSRSMIELVLDFGADVNGSDTMMDDRSFLQAASYGYGADIVELLLKRGADIDAIGTHGTALQCAVTRHDSNDTVIQLLLEHGALVDARGTELENACPALQRAAEHGAETAVQLLLDYGANANAIDASLYVMDGGYISAIHAAAGSGHASIVTMLLAHTLRGDERIDINIYIALTAALFHGHHDIVRMLRFELASRAFDFDKVPGDDDTDEDMDADSDESWESDMSTDPDEAPETLSLW